MRDQGGWRFSDQRMSSGTEEACFGEERKGETMKALSFLLLAYLYWPGCVCMYTRKRSINAPGCAERRHGKTRVFAASC